MEGLQIRHQQELSHMTDMKDQEIAALQEQLQSTYRDMASEIDSLQQKVMEVSNDKELKVKMSQQQLLSSDESHKLLNDHIAKLQAIIQSKAEMNASLDQQN